MEEKWEASEIAEYLREKVRPFWQNITEKLAESVAAAYEGDTADVHEAVGEAAAEAVRMLHAIGHTAFMFAKMQDMPDETAEKVLSEMEKQMKLGESLAGYIPDPPGVIVCYDDAQWEWLNHKMGEYQHGG